MSEPSTLALAEAIYRAQHSDPYSDPVDRAWGRLQPTEGYSASITQSLLRDQGYEIVPVNPDA